MAKSAQQRKEAVVLQEPETPDPSPHAETPPDTDLGSDAKPNAQPDTQPDVVADVEAVPGDSDAEITTPSVIEAILLATDTPLPATRIAKILGVGDARDVKKHITALNDDYAQTGRSFRIEEIAKGFQILTLPKYNGWLTKVLHVRGETKLSGAALETLAIIAYKQPALRAEIESIRGVAGGEMINRLREMDLVKIVGRAEELGRPMLYGTTKRFLEVFGLASLDDLPQAEELSPPPTSSPPPPAGSPVGAALSDDSPTDAPPADDSPTTSEET